MTAGNLDDPRVRALLETGSWPCFIPARAFYQRFGFEECGPFGDYVPIPTACS